MLRATTLAQLDDVVSRSRITLVHGLPRVGRTDLLRRWQHGRSDTIRGFLESNDDDFASTRIFDHLSFDEVDGFVRRYRAAEEAKADTRFVVVPVDLATAEQLRNRLAGSIETFALMPLQLNDVIAQISPLSMPEGPIQGLVAEPTPTNAEAFDPKRHWLRGGLPESLVAESDEHSLAWRLAMLDTLLARDYTRWGLTGASRLPDVLRWLANQNGGELDDNSCPFAKRADLRSALYVLERLGLIRSLANFPAGSSPSLGKKAKVFIRDSGILHAVLGVVTVEQLDRHPRIGESWEGYAIEALIAAGAERCVAQFYRMKGDESENEIDLVLDFTRVCGKRIAIECKVSPEEPAKAGFYRGCESIDATDCFVVHSGSTSISAKVNRFDLLTALRHIAQIADSK